MLTARITCGKADICQAATGKPTLLKPLSNTQRTFYALLKLPVTLADRIPVICGHPGGAPAGALATLKNILNN